MSTELDLPDLGWSYDDFVRAWHEVESRSAWFKARLAGAVEGDLRQFGTDVGTSYQTVKNYRSVDRAFPAAEFGRPNFSFGVAEALMAQDDRCALVSRPEPWTVAEARELARARRELARQDPHKDAKAALGAGKPKQVTAKPEVASKPVRATDVGSKPSEAEQEASQQVADAVPDAKPDPGPAPCPGCRDLEAKLTAAEEQITRLRAARPDAVLTAEKEFLADQNAALAARVRVLEKARRSEAPGSAEQAAPATVPQTGEQAADGEPCARCKAPGAPPVLIELPDGEQDTAYACDPCLEIARSKQPEVTFTRPEPVTTQGELDEIYASFTYDDDEAITRS